MKAAVMVDADWPGDEVILVGTVAGFAALPAVIEAPGVTLGRVGENIVALMGRPAFRHLRKAVVALDDATRQREGTHRPLSAFRAILDTLARELAEARDDDKSGDPLPGTPLHAAMAAELAEAGR